MPSSLVKRMRMARYAARPGPSQAAPFGQHAPDFGKPALSQFLLRQGGLIIGPDGDTDCSGQVSEKSSLSPPAEPVARCSSGGRMFGEGVMATALVDVFPLRSLRFDELVLEPDYRPSETESFMCDAQRAYFLR